MMMCDHEIIGYTSSREPVCGKCGLILDPAERESLRGMKLDPTERKSLAHLAQEHFDRLGGCL